MRSSESADSSDGNEVADVPEDSSFRSSSESPEITDVADVTESSEGMDVADVTESWRLVGVLPRIPAEMSWFLADRVFTSERRFLADNWSTEENPMTAMMMAMLSFMIDILEDSVNDLAGN